MRDTTSTPIIRYDGPPELRKSLEMEGRKFLGYVKGVLGGGLPYQKYVGRYNDGTTIEVQSISHVGELDIIKIKVPVYYEEVSEQAERKKRVIENVSVVERLVPICDIGDKAPFEDGASENVYLFWPSPKFGGFLYYAEGTGEEPELILEYLIQGNTEIELRDVPMQYLIYDEGGGEVS